MRNVSCSKVFFSGGDFVSVRSVRNISQKYILEDTTAFLKSHKTVKHIWDGSNTFQLLKLINNKLTFNP